MQTEHQVTVVRFNPDTDEEYEIEVTVEGNYTPGESPEKFYPGCPSEFEVEDAVDENGNWVSLTKEETQELHAECRANYGETDRDFRRIKGEAQRLAAAEDRWEERGCRW